MLTSCGMEARAMSHNIMPVTPTLASKEGPLMLSPEIYPQKCAIIYLIATPASPTLPAF